MSRFTADPTSINLLTIIYSLVTQHLFDTSSNAKGLTVELHVRLQLDGIATTTPICEVVEAGGRIAEIVEELILKDPRATAWGLFGVLDDRLIGDLAELTAATTKTAREWHADR